MWGSQVLSPTGWCGEVSGLQNHQGHISALVILFQKAVTFHTLASSVQVILLVTITSAPKVLELPFLQGTVPVLRLRPSFCFACSAWIRTLCLFVIILSILRKKNNLLWDPFSCLNLKSTALFRQSHSLFVLSEGPEKIQVASRSTISKWICPLPFLGLRSQRQGSSFPHQGHSPKSVSASWVIQHQAFYSRLLGCCLVFCSRLLSLRRLLFMLN